MGARVSVDFDAADRGTPSADWDAWFAGRTPDPELAVPGDCRRLVVVAPHPDDEVLGVGVLASRFARAGVEVRVVGVTDGDASHPGSPTHSPQRLAARRVEESRRACAVLGLPAPERLGLPDGRVADDEVPLAFALAELLGAADPTTWVLVTWRGDGHPDHEACGRAAATACAATGARLVEYPVWTWHWAEPGDPRVPWGRRRRIVPDRAELTAKREAVAEFATQIAPLSELPGDEVILPAWVVERLVAPEETVFV